MGKCDVYILKHIWDNRLHNRNLADKSYCPGIRNVVHEGQRKAITGKEPNVATLFLGVMFAPSGDMTDQVHHLRAKSVAWADLLRTKRISPEAVWYSLTASIMKTIEYPLLATSNLDVTKGATFHHGTHQSFYRLYLEQIFADKLAEMYSIVYQCTMGWVYKIHILHKG